MGDALTKRDDLAGTRVLVTGASGFVGRRLVERLAFEKAHVRALVRQIARAAPLSRFPTEIAVGDLLRPDDVDNAVAGCQIVVHCAKGSSGSLAERRAVDVDGTRNLLDAAQRHGVERVVHVSTVVAYDIPREGTLDERSPPTRTRDAYATAKRDGELVARSLGRDRGVSVAVIQPTVVYGPYAGVYGRDIIDELRTSRLILVDGGDGICNALFIDDLVTALMLAATRAEASGEVFLVTGPESVTWRTFFEAFERMLGVSRLVPMPADEARRLWKRSSRRSWLIPELRRAVRNDAQLRGRLVSTKEGQLVRRVAERVLPEAYFAPERWVPEPTLDDQGEPQLAALRSEVIDFLSSRAIVSSDKARRLLGYEPVFGLSAGMSLTEQWARHEGLLEPR